MSKIPPLKRLTRDAEREAQILALAAKGSPDEAELLDDEGARRRLKKTRATLAALVKKSADFLNDLKAKYQWPSDYRAAKELGVTQKTVQTWRAGRGAFSDSMAIKVAHLLELDASYVIACAHAEREREAHVIEQWHRIAETFFTKKVRASILLAGLGLLGAGSPAPSAAYAHTAQAEAPSLYIMSNRRRVRRRRRSRPGLLPPGPALSLA